MNFRSKLILIGLAATAAAFQPAAAQTAPAAAGFTAGAKVADTAGGEVGTITSVDGDFVILKTDKHEVRLPKTSFTAHEGGFIMAMTRDQVNACVEIATRAGYDFLVLDQTRPDVQVPVVRVLVPGLRHFYRRFAPGRLYDVPVKLGLLDRPRPESELTPFLPHT